MGEDDQDSVWLDIESLSLGNGLPISLACLPFVLNIKKYNTVIITGFQSGVGMEKPKLCYLLLQNKDKRTF